MGNHIQTNFCGQLFALSERLWHSFWYIVLQLNKNKQNGKDYYY